jgi:hypothetical protein
VTVHDDDLGCAGILRATHRRVDLLRVQTASLFVERLAAITLLSLRHPGHALDVADDVNAHGPSS